MRFCILSQVVLLGLLVFCGRIFGIDDVKNVEVVGIGECGDCKDSNIKTSQAVSGLKVTIDCKSKNGEIHSIGAGELDNEGKFKVSLPKEILKSEKELNEECFVQLHSASLAPCGVHDGLDAMKIAFQSKTDKTHTFSPAGKLKFSSTVCTSAFLWPYYKYPPLPPMSSHPWFKKFHDHSFLFPPLPPKVYPPYTFPPLPPKVFPPISFHKPLPPPTPIYTPVYKPPVVAPVYKPPVVAPVYKPPVVAPVYKPPVYKPPVYKPPVYKPPVYKPPVVAPVYKPPVVEPTKPLPPPFPFYKKPCPPLPKLPPLPPKSYFHHPIAGFPPLPPKFKSYFHHPIAGFPPLPPKFKPYFPPLPPKFNHP